MGTHTDIRDLVAPLRVDAMFTAEVAKLVGAILHTLPERLVAVQRGAAHVDWGRTGGVYPSGAYVVAAGPWQGSENSHSGRMWHAAGARVVDMLRGLGVRADLRFKNEPPPGCSTDPNAPTELRVSVADLVAAAKAPPGRAREALIDAAEAGQGGA